MPKKNKSETCVMTKEAIREAYSRFAEGFLEQIKAAGLDLIDEGVVGKDPYHHVLLAISRITNAQTEESGSTAVPPGTIFN